jgi:cell division protein ZapD
VILYEYPFNERIRTCLRLEHLFLRLGTLMAREDALDHHFALATIFEIMDVAARADLKSEVLRDLEKQRQLLDSYRGNPAISEQALNDVIGRLERAYAELNAQSGKAGQSLSENEWLMSIRSRISIPGGTCEFDLPAYYAWQQGAPATRQTDLNRWATCLTPLKTAIELLLRLLRESGSAQKVIGAGGQYQQNLPQGRSFQLLRLRLNPLASVVPEISGNRLMVSVRFMRMQDDDRLHACAQDTAFELTLCS